MGFVYNRIDRRLVFGIGWLLRGRGHLCEVGVDRLKLTVANDLLEVESTGFE